MKVSRRFVPAVLQAAALAAVSISGMAIAAQNQNEPQPTQPVQKAAPKNPADQPDDAAQDRNQPAEQNRNAQRNPDAKKQAGDQTNPNQPGDRNSRTAQKAAALGAKLDLQGEQGNQGLTVTTIEQDGVLAQAGLKQNDRIVSIDGRGFNNARQFEAYLWSQPGRQVPIIIDRGGRQYTIQVAMPAPTTDGGWLGVYLEEGDADAQGEAPTKGALVTQVYPGSPASRAGLQVGDIVTQINQQQIDGSADAVMLLRDMAPQSQVELAVLRDKENVKIPVVLGSRRNSMYQSFYTPQSNQQPGQFGNGNDQRFTGNDQFNGVPPYAMQLEHDRRNAEQHERIEDEIRMLRDEIRQLRELLEKK